ncbi:hypothetical protein [uncultured Prevotella sp.]|uniref:hypothetical protein n=1 Tax=uncultured Prevotella sp. TaxID=159272 RepID=UPI002613053A|nr:hypothetical protein [uncultured Prevotella sp.]
MKRTYIKPDMAIQKIEACTIMVGSNDPSGPTLQKEAIGVRSFAGDQMYYNDKLIFGGDADKDVTPSSKDHDMWDDVLE